MKKLLFLGVFVLLGGLSFFVFSSGICIGCAPTGKVVATKPEIVSLSAFEFSQNHKEGVLIDIRTPEEFNSGHLEGAVNLDFYSPSFRADLDSLGRDGFYFIYCRSGSRTSQAKILMESLGFNNVYALRGGVLAWNSAGLPLKT